MITAEAGSYWTCCSKKLKSLNNFSSNFSDSVWLSSMASSSFRGGAHVLNVGENEKTHHHQHACYGRKLNRAVGSMTDIWWIFTIGGIRGLWSSIFLSLCFVYEKGLPVISVFQCWFSVGYRWCWSRCKMLMTESLLRYVMEFFKTLFDFNVKKLVSKTVESVIYIWNLSPTYFTSNVRYQHRCSFSWTHYIKLMSHFIKLQPAMKSVSCKSFMRYAQLIRYCTIRRLNRFMCIFTFNWKIKYTKTDLI